MHSTHVFNFSSGYFCEHANPSMNNKSDPDFIQTNDDTEYPVKVKLEELLGGAQRRMRVRRRRFNRMANSFFQESRVLVFNIPPGARNGTRIRFEKEGEEIYPNSPPGDVIFILEVEPHDLFFREGSNLRTGCKIDLKLALLGGNLTVSTQNDPKHCTAR